MCVKTPEADFHWLKMLGEEKALHSFFTLNCSVCLNMTEFCSSKRSEQLVSRPFDFNTRSVHASLSEGLGHSGLKKICASFDLPRPSGNRPFNVILKRLSKNSENIAEHKMKEAAERLIEIVKSESPDQIENLPDGNVVANVSVTVDGTWQGRGYVISVRTSKILDYVLKTKYCHECTSHNKDDRTNKTFLHCQIEHKDKCCISHFGSSGSMEKEGAIEIFL